MMSIEINQVVKIIDGRVVCGDAAGSVDGVSIDSRTVQRGDLFFAIRGEHFDGHDYIRAAIGKGALCVVAEHDINLPAGNSTAVVVVDDTIAALGRLAGWYRQQVGAKVIAITGSAGKTTVRQILHQVLSGFYRCRQAPKSFNNHIGVPLAILSAEADDEILLLELGANHAGEISSLTKMSKPDAAVVTFIGPAHLEGFGTLENVFKEKAAITEGLCEGGRLYVNGDQPELVEKAETMFNGRIIAFGTNQNCDVIGTDFQLCGNKGSLVIEGQLVNVPLAGKANLMNVLTVWSVCKDLKVGLSDFIQIIGRLTPVSMRLEVNEFAGLTVLNDSYNANPASMANALECLKTFGNPEKRRLVFIAGDMHELGDQSRRLHFELGRKAVDEGIQLVLCAGQFARAIAEGATAHLPSVPVQVFVNTDDLCDNLYKYIQPDDIILVKGSRAAGLEKAVQRLHELF